MLQRQVPYGEGFEFGVACLDPSFMLMIQLGKAGGHFAASRAGRRDDNQRFGGFHIFVAAVAFIADNQVDIIRITFNYIMKIRTETQIGQAAAVLVGGGLSRILGDNNGIGQEAHFAEGFDKAQDLSVVGKAGIPADFIFFNGRRADDQYDFRLILQLLEHFEFAVRFKAGKDAGSMVIVKKLSAKLQIKLVAEHGDPLLNVF